MLTISLRFAGSVVGSEIVYATGEGFVNGDFRLYFLVCDTMYAEHDCACETTQNFVVHRLVPLYVTLYFR